MNWPWRNVSQNYPAPGTPNPGAPGGRIATVEMLVAQADALRDARRWAEAAAAYHVVLQRDPGRAALWVQCGHALKESHDLAGAESAYRKSLELSPDVADTHLQLGHVLKLQGRRAAAVAAYAMALKADRGCTPALTELIALGEGWEAEQASSLGLPMLGSLLETAQQLRTALSRLEQALPDAASLASCPPALFQSRYRLPPPPASRGPSPDSWVGSPALSMSPLAWGVLVLDRARPEAVVALLRSLAEQAMPPAGVVVVSEQAATRTALEQFSNGGLSCPVAVAGAGAAITLPPGDWLLVCVSGTVLVPGAGAWLDWAAGQLGADGFYCDEAGSSPVLKAAHDPEADVPPFRHTLLALRGSIAAAALAGAVQASDPLQAMADAAAACGGLGHLARILVQRIVEVAPAARRERAVDNRAEDKRIGVVIPTRNSGGMLRDCVEALRRTAAEPFRLDIVIEDNGSDDAVTLALLSELETAGVARVLRDAAVFNWARQSNAGAAACRSELLLFINDDVTLASHGWDEILRRQLARPEVGAVGVRLEYPDGGLQHGGIVLGPGGRAEHEGVATVGVLPDIAARWVTRRRVAAVTGAFLGCRRADFDAVGGFDAAHFPIWFNDIDFCLKLRQAGLLILYEPGIRATHYESRTLSAQAHDAGRQSIWDDSLRTMQQRWGDALRTDPGFNPHFSRHGRPFELLMEPSPAAVLAHLLRSARSDVWRPGDAPRG